MAVLIGMSEEMKGRSFAIDGDTVTIGRAPANTVIIEHPAVSGLHCQLTREGDSYRLKDMGSTNGTRVNGKEIQDVLLNPRDLVQLGTIEFLFETSGVMTATEAHPVLTAPAAVVETRGPPTTPISFGSISPYGPRHKDSWAIWYFVIALLAVLALLGVGYVVWTLFLS